MRLSFFPTNPQHAQPYSTPQSTNPAPSPLLHPPRHHSPISSFRPPLALPAGITQFYAILHAEKVTKTAVVSIMVACSSIAFTSSTISYDLDTAPNKRRGNPGVYGFIRNSPTARSATFLCLFTLSLSHVMSKFLTIALLTSIDLTLTISYLAGDMILFWAYKLLRGDFRYWPNLPPVLSAVVSVCARFIIKTLVSCLLSPNTNTNPNPNRRIN